MTRRNWIAVGAVAAVLAVPAGLAVADVGPNEESGDVPGFSELSVDDQAVTRDHLTRVVTAMEAHGATADEIAPFVDRLELLGGPDPNTPTYEQRMADRPDWMVDAQERLDACHAGDQTVCDEIDAEAAKGLEEVTDAQGE